MVWLAVAARCRASVAVAAVRVTGPALPPVTLKVKLVPLALASPMVTVPAPLPEEAVKVGVMPVGAPDTVTVIPWPETTLLLLVVTLKVGCALLKVKLVETGLEAAVVGVAAIRVSTLTVCGKLVALTCGTLNVTLPEVA